MEPQQKKKKGSGMQDGGAFLKLLVRTKASSAFPKDDDKPPRVYYASRDTPVHTLWKELIARGIQAVPILCKKKKEYYGMLDLKKIVEFTLNSLKTEEMDDDFFAKIDAADELKTKKVKDIMEHPLKASNPYQPIDKDFSALHVIETLSRSSSDLHQVTIISSSDRVVYDFVTQFRMLEWMMKHKDYLGFIADETVGTVFNKEVTKVEETENVGEAFLKMIKGHFSALAVVDKNGKLVGNLSLGDLKGIGPDATRFWRINQVVKNFLKNMKRDYPSHKKGKHDQGRPRTIVTAQSSDSMWEVMTKLSSNHIHRLYVVDENKHPIGVISLKDLMEKIIDTASSETS